ncbi:MAG: methyl-accepting chemotaxis protein [Gammaproteobacteria bacterium]|nr:methyl-accepting chemotaxis protein [Gammaproteobacteria bacterium]
MKQIKFKQLLFFMALGTGTLLSIFGIGTYQTSSDLTEAIRKQESLTDTMLLLKETRFNIVQIQQFLTDVGATGDYGAQSEAQEHLAAANSLLDKLSNDHPILKVALLEAKQSLHALYDTGVRMAEAYVEIGRDEGNAIMKASGSGFDDASALLASQIEAMVKTVDEEYRESVRVLDEVTALKTKFGYANVATTLMLFMIIFSTIYRKILPPLNNLMRSLNDLNSGRSDLSRRLPVDSSDELGLVVNQFNLFIDKLQRMVDQLRNSVTPVADAAHKVEEASSKTHESSQTQAEETEKVAAAITEMAATVQEVARNASTTMDATDSAMDQAKHGNAVVKQTIENINALANEVENASKVINQMDSFSIEVGNVLEVIKEIAEQTNLLALNAAIEAARAGEQGRGFAVVADEVRTLAGRTQSSTAEIEDMVDKLQRTARTAVSAMQSGHEKAKLSVHSASIAGESLDTITAAVTTIHNMTAQIATAAEEQNAVAEEINRNVLVIRDIASNNFVSANDAKRELSVLVELADHLKEVSQQF